MENVFGYEFDDFKCIWIDQPHEKAKVFLIKERINVVCLQEAYLRVTNEMFDRYSVAQYIMQHQGAGQKG